MFSALTALLAVFRMVVIPAQFQDTHFSCTETELETIVLKAQDYFNDQFGRQCEFSFDLAPSVTLPKDLSYYGANYSDRKDALLYEAVRDACLQSSEDIDFSVYDNDFDGEVDNVFIPKPTAPVRTASGPSTAFSRIPEPNSTSTARPSTASPYLASSPPTKARPPAPLG